MSRHHGIMYMYMCMYIYVLVQYKNNIIHTCAYVLSCMHTILIILSWQPLRLYQRSTIVRMLPPVGAFGLCNTPHNFMIITGTLHAGLSFELPVTWTPHVVSTASPGTCNTKVKEATLGQARERKFIRTCVMSQTDDCNRYGVW